MSGAGRRWRKSGKGAARLDYGAPFSRESRSFRPRGRRITKGKFCITGGAPVNKGLGTLQMSVAKWNPQRGSSRPWRCFRRRCTILPHKLRRYNCCFILLSVPVLRIHMSEKSPCRGNALRRRGPAIWFQELALLLGRITRTPRSGLQTRQTTVNAFSSHPHRLVNVRPWIRLPGLTAFWNR
jgi:hypothetical protein